MMTPTLTHIGRTLWRLASPFSARCQPRTRFDGECEIRRTSRQLEDARLRTGLLLGSDIQDACEREPEAERMLIAAEREMMLCLAKLKCIERQAGASSTSSAPRSPWYAARAWTDSFKGTRGFKASLFKGERLSHRTIEK